MRRAAIRVCLVVRLQLDEDWKCVCQFRIDTVGSDVNRGRALGGEPDDFRYVRHFQQIADDAIVTIEDKRPPDTCEHGFLRARTNLAVADDADLALAEDLVDDVPAFLVQRAEVRQYRLTLCLVVIERRAEPAHCLARAVHEQHVFRLRHDRGNEGRHVARHVHVGDGIAVTAARLAAGPGDAHRYIPDVHALPSVTTGMLNPGARRGGAMSNWLIWSR